MLQNLDIGPGFYVFIGALFGIIIGWLIGFFDSNMRTAKKIQVAETKSEEIIKEAEKKIADAQEKVTAGTAADNPGLLRLKTDNNGRFVIEMDGGRIPDVLSPDKKKRLIELITVFRPWLEGGQPAQAVPQPGMPVPAQPAPTPFQSALSALQPLAQPLIPPKKPVEEKDIRSLSIVAQIDTVLQMKLANTTLATRGIRITESSTGGVEVYVGIDQYPSIDDVPDAEIKNIIRAAIAEWEQKYIPGM